MSNYGDYMPDRSQSNGPGNQPTGEKRTRRMRSIQGAAHYGNGQKGKKGPGAYDGSEYHDRKNAAPIFLQKTYTMISNCNPDIAGWTEDGTMFVIKDIKVFEQTIIPQFFDHNKFSSFARQLNFYGFRKMQARPIYNKDVNEETAKHVKFYNEKFQRGRPELLKEIQRSTKGGQNGQTQELQREVDSLKKRVSYLEQAISDMQQNYDIRLAAIQTQLKNFLSYSNDSDPIITEYVAPNSTTQTIPTLEPHPNSKVLPANHAPPPPPPARHGSIDMNFLRGLSTYDMGEVSEVETGFGAFEQKFLQSALSISSIEAPKSNMMRQASESLEKLNLNNLEEFPELDKPMG